MSPAPRPAVSATTTRLYERLPELYRRADEAADAGPNGYPLLRYLSLIVDQLGDLEVLVDRIDYVPEEDGGAAGDTSDLTDPLGADEAWLPWLAQLVGTDYGRLTGLDLTGRRLALAGAASGWRAGTREGIAAAVRPLLTGTRFVRVQSHLGGDPWRVEIRTRVSETPVSSAEVIAAVVRAQAKPAGVELVHTPYEAAWSDIEAVNPTWADVEAQGSWTEIEESGAP